MNFPGVEFLETAPKFKKRENYFSCVYVLHKNFTSQSCSDSKEMYRKACCMCRVVVLLISFTAFLTFSLPSSFVHKHYVTTFPLRNLTKLGKVLMLEYRKTQLNWTEADSAA